MNHTDNLIVLLGGKPLIAWVRRVDHACGMSVWLHNGTLMGWWDECAQARTGDEGWPVTKLAAARVGYSVDELRAMVREATS